MTEPAAAEHRRPDALRTHRADRKHVDGDTGRGLGAGHQSGWTALVALLLAERAAR